METPSTESPRELPIVGGHVALDFANTVDDPLGPARHDHAATYEDLVNWSVRVGTVTQVQASRLLDTAAHRPHEADAAVADAHELRVTLNDLFGGIADGAPEVSRHWTKLRAFVADAITHATVVEADAGPRQWSWSQVDQLGVDQLGVLLHPIAAAAASLLVSDDVRRIKRCARCPWIFLDRSKNHSRRWCDMNDCGKAQKIERYVARRAAAKRRTG